MSTTSRSSGPLGAGRRIGIALASTALVAVGLAACGSSSNDNSSSKKTSTGSTTPAAAAHSVRLSADEGGGLYFKPKKLGAKPGTVTLVMKNPGSSGLMHGIAVEGHGVDKDGPVVAPGKTSTVTVSLKAGSYEFYCPFDSHKAKGMKGTLTVGSSSAASAATNTTTSGSGGNSKPGY
jgi:uncharacterized cupredoxin-like copper-binding protein